MMSIPGEASRTDLEAAAPYELGGSGFIVCLYPAYVRGQAYLLEHNGTAAAVEFQKLIDHSGIVVNSVTGALAHLQIGRAYAMSGDTAKAKAAYQDFLTLWKDADPDIPILKQANAEYAKLQSNSGYNRFLSSLASGGNQICVTLDFSGRTRFIQ
jgi:eukaryotic-like serine/threonine-protein kinase